MAWGGVGGVDPDPEGWGWRRRITPIHNKYKPATHAHLPDMLSEAPFTSSCLAENMKGTCRGRWAGGEGAVVGGGAGRRPGKHCAQQQPRFFC